MRGARWYGDLGPDGRKAFWSSYAGFGLDAMNIQLYAFVLPVLMSLWKLSASRAGLLASIALFSGAAGGWMAGCLSDRVGRVRVLRVSIIWLAISTALCGFAEGYEQLLVARVVQGLGFGAEWAVGIVFMSEIVPPALRGRAVGTAQSAWDVGWALAAAVTSISLALLPPDIGWRATFFAGLVPAIMLFRARSGLRESPTFACSSLRQTWHAIFSRSMWRNTMKGSLLAVGTHGGYWAIASWWPTMLLLQRGMSAAQAGLHMAGLIAGSFIGYVLGAWLSDRAGRRHTLRVFALGGILIVLATTLLPLSDIALLVLSPALGLFALGIYSAMGPVLSELYPTPLRGSGLGFCYNVGRGVAGATPLVVGGSVAAFGYSHAIGLCVAAAYSLVLIAAALLKETRGLDFAAAGEMKALSVGLPGRLISNTAINSISGE